MESPIKRPKTAFFLFKEKMSKDGTKYSSKELGEMWAKLSETQKEVYQEKYADEKEKYEAYLETMGIVRKDSRPKEKVSPMGIKKADHFRTKRVRLVLGGDRKILPIDKTLCKGLGYALEEFMTMVSKDVAAKMKEEQKQTLNLEMAIQVIEENPAFIKLSHSDQFSKIISEIEDETAERKEKKKEKEKEKEKKKTKDRKDKKVDKGKKCDKKKQLFDQ